MLQDVFWNLDLILGKVLNGFSQNGCKSFLFPRVVFSLYTSTTINMLTSLLTVLNLVASSLALVK